MILKSSDFRIKYWRDIVALTRTGKSESVRSAMEPLIPSDKSILLQSI